MTTETTHRAFRTAVVTVALALATTVGASANVLVPAVSTGGAGGGSGIAFDAPTQNERSIQMSESTLTATGALAGGGTVATTPNQRSIELSESKEAPGGILAGGTAPPRQVAYEDSEHAQAQNASASAEQAPQASEAGQVNF